MRSRSGLKRLTLSRAQFERIRRLSATVADPYARSPLAILQRVARLRLITTLCGVFCGALALWGLCGLMLLHQTNLAPWRPVFLFTALLWATLPPTLGWVEYRWCYRRYGDGSARAFDQFCHEQSYRRRAWIMLLGLISAVTLLI